MKKTYLFSGYLIVFSVIILVFTGFRSDKNFRVFRSNEPIIDMYLDSIGTGPITQKQLLSVKKLVVISNGVSCGIKSFDISWVPIEGDALFDHCVGFGLPAAIKDCFKRGRPKDMIIISNAKYLSPPDNYKPDPHKSAVWTVIADK